MDVAVGGGVTHKKKVVQVWDGCSGGGCCHSQEESSTGYEMDGGDVAVGSAVTHKKKVVQVWDGWGGCSGGGCCHPQEESSTGYEMDGGDVAVGGTLRASSCHRDRWKPYCKVCQWVQLRQMAAATHSQRLRH